MGPARGQIGMDSKQRFRSDRPCPVCGGHANLSRGKGRRCYGYLSDDGLYAHCTREEHARAILTEKSRTPRPSPTF